MNSKNKKKILAIIPARSESKRLPGKNILPLCGKPLIGWSIEAARASEFITEVMVSTDHEAIAEIALQYKSKVPFLRPKELSTDTASSYEVVKHTIEFYKNLNEHFHYIALLQPTSPLRDYKDIDNAISLLFNKNADAVVSVNSVEHSPLLCNNLPKDHSLKGFLPEQMKNKRSQDYPAYYRINGAIYLCDVQKFMEQKTFFLKDNIFAFIMPADKSVDIDTKLDFITASAILSQKK